MTQVHFPLDEKKTNRMRAGDEVNLNGILYSARDRAHKILAHTIRRGEELPIDLGNQVIYYMGPAPTPPGLAIGSCGPTTASRMDLYTPLLLDNGLKGMIGKGSRSPEVIRSMTRHKAVYFYAFGGCGALYASRIKSYRIAAYPELGPEAIYELEVENFPVLVGIDVYGKSIFAA